MMVGKVSYDGCTFSTANKLQRWLRDRIEASRSTNVQHLLPITVDIPLRTQRDARTCQAWVQLSVPTTNNIWAVSDIISGRFFDGVQLYAEPASKPATHQLSLTKVYSWSAAKGSLCNRNCTLCRTTNTQRSEHLTTPSPLMSVETRSARRITYSTQDARFSPEPSILAAPTEPAAPAGPVTPAEPEPVNGSTLTVHLPNPKYRIPRLAKPPLAALPTHPLAAPQPPSPTTSPTPLATPPEPPVSKKTRKPTRRHISQSRQPLQRNSPATNGLRLLGERALHRRGKRLISCRKYHNINVQRQLMQEDGHIYAQSFEEYKERQEEQAEEARREEWNRKGQLERVTALLEAKKAGDAKKLEEQAPLSDQMDLEVLDWDLADVTYKFGEEDFF